MAGSSKASEMLPALTTSQQHFTALSQALNHALPVRLDRTNFILWHAQMENVIYANGLEDFVDGTAAAPPQHLPNSSALNPEFIQWRRKDRLILSWIYSSLSPELMSQIVGMTTTASAWAALQTFYSSSSNARILQLRLQLQTIKKGGMLMMDYTLKVKNLADQLAAIQEKVSDRDLVLYLLAGLGADFNSFIVSVTSKSKALSFGQVSSLLLAHESRLEQQLSTDEHATVIANVAQRNFNHSRGSGPNRPPSRGFSNPSHSRS